MTDLAAAADQYDDVARRIDDPRERSQASTVRSTVALIEGRYADSEEWTTGALALGRESGDYNAELVFHAQGLLAPWTWVRPPTFCPCWWRPPISNASPASPPAPRCAPPWPATGSWPCACLDRLMDSGPGRISPRGRPSGPDGLSGSRLRPSRGRRTCRSPLAPLFWLSPPRRAGGPLVGWWGPVDHHMGACIAVLGRFEEAEFHLRRALDLEQQMGARPFSARTRGELARLLGASGRPEADIFRAEAVAEADALAAPGLAAEVVLRLERA